MWMGLSTSVRGGGCGCVCSGIDSSAWLIFFFFVLLWAVVVVVVVVWVDHASWLNLIIYLFFAIGCGYHNVGVVLLWVWVCLWLWLWLWVWL